MRCQWYESSHCQSCGLLHLPYAETLKFKTAKLLELIPECTQHLAPAIGLSKAEASRSKAKLAVYRSSATSKIAFGFYDEKGHAKELEHCPLHRDDLNKVLPLIEKLCESYKIEPYDLLTKKGELKYLILSQSESHDDILLRFTLRSKESLDRLKKMSAEIIAEFPKVKVITANLQPLHQAIIEGDEEIVLSENKVIQHRFGEVNLNLGPRSFFQVTPEIAHKLYAAVATQVKAFNIHSFLDLYCGVGAFSYFAAQSAAKVLGVEISEEAIRCAESSRNNNRLKGQIEFRSLDVEKFLLQNPDAFEAILVNPPRRGLSETIIHSLIRSDATYLFYSSCNVQTLARDHKLLETDFSLVSAQIFDMFPFTEHFETLMVYRRK